MSVMEPVLLIIGMKRTQKGAILGPPKKALRHYAPYFRRLGPHEIPAAVAIYRIPARSLTVNGPVMLPAQLTAVNANSGPDLSGHFPGGHLVC